MNINLIHTPAIFPALAAFLGLLIAPLSQAHAADALERAERYPSEMRYVISRKGKNVGSHRVQFTKNGASLQVDVESKIKITILKVPVFKFSYVAKEVWQDNKLVSIEARTNNGGDITEANFASGDSIDPIPFSSNHWHADVVNANRIFNTLTGEVSVVDVQALGNDQLGTGDNKIS